MIPFLGEIDTVLARYSEFTETEQDSIINREIKYRLGRDTEPEEE